MKTETKTPGQMAYERDLALMPFYCDGRPRRQWSQLESVTKTTWERNPQPRNYENARKVFSEFDFNSVNAESRLDMQRFVKYASEIGEQLIRKKVGEVAILLNRKVIFLANDANNDLVVCISKEPAQFQRDSIIFNGECVRVKSSEDLADYDFQDDIKVMQHWLRSRVSVSFREKSLKVSKANKH